jgi:hypothetical protein
MHTEGIDGKKKISADVYQTISDTIESFSWGITVEKKDILELDKGNVPSQFAAILAKAASAETRLVRDIKRIIFDENLKTWVNLSSLKKTVKALESNLSNIEHIQNWHDMPDDSVMSAGKMNAFLAEIAASTQLGNELLETAKGYIKSVKK